MSDTVFVRFKIAMSVCYDMYVYVVNIYVKINFDLLIND